MKNSVPIHVGQGKSPLLRQHRTILLVEDDEQLLQLLTLVVEAQGYSVLTARTANAALEITQQNKSIDLVVTDLGLPDCDGIQLLEQLQVIYPWVRGLIVSGYSAETLPEGLQLPHGTVFLPKPFSFGAFIAAVRKLLLQ